MSESSPYDVPGPFTSRLNGNPDPLQPGTEGWWTVAGAHPLDIRPGDVVLTGWKDDDWAANGVIHHAEYEVAEMAPYGGTMDTIRVRFLTTAGTFGSVGMLQPMALARRGTHRTLGDYVR